MTPRSPDFACPVPDSGDAATITLAHGEGGRLMRRLVRERLLPAVDNEYLSRPGRCCPVARLARDAWR